MLSCCCLLLHGVLMRQRLWRAEFSSALCPETWKVNDGIVVITGQSEAVKNAQALELKRQEEMTDAFGNTVKVRLRLGPPLPHVGAKRSKPLCPCA